eukprot:5614726-Alexandrium_andersonii.AAC.1
MSASLVGSEMCIRDSISHGLQCNPQSAQGPARALTSPESAVRPAERAGVRQALGTCTVRPPNSVLL